MVIAFYCGSSFAQDSTEEDPCVTFQFTDIIGEAGDTVCSELRIIDSIDILSFQFSVEFDDSVLEYLNCVNANTISSFSCNDVNLQDEDPVLKVLWFDPLGNSTILDSATLLMSLCFNLKAQAEAGTTLLAFSDDLESEAVIENPNDLSNPKQTEFCATGDITSSLIHVRENTSLSVYPNPVGSTLFIQNIDPESYPIQLSFYNTQGQLVRSHQIKPVQSSISTEELEAGQYFIRIDMSDGAAYSSMLSKF